MKKGKGNRLQKKGQRTGKGTNNRKGGKDQDNIREPKQDSETKTRFGNQNKIQKPKQDSETKQNSGTKTKFGNQTKSPARPKGCRG